jgi:two-component system response regulator LytT
VIRIAVCEDEQILLEQLTDDIKSILNKHSVMYSIKAYTNGNALLARGVFDILFLDIAMKPLNGLEIARKLRARGDESRLVFITAHQRYAIDAYDVQAYHYLLKPVDIEKLEAVLLKLCSLLKEECEHAVAIRQGTTVRRVPYEQILYLEVMNRKIYLHKNEETLPFYGKLDEIETTLPDTFFRCHRSYIVNLDHVRYYKKEEVWLDNETVVPLSRRRYQAFGLAFMYYLKNRGDVF